jgi:C-terminal processing protease CtpA/Prc
MRGIDVRALLTIAIALFALPLSACRDVGASDADAGADAGDPYDLPGPPFAEQVDDYWGAAPDAETRLAIFDALWQNLADAYAGFSVLDVDWDEVRERYRSQVAAAEGYGRFYQLLSWMNAELEDGHTSFSSYGICGTPLSLRPPFFRPDQWSSAIGACVTPLDDGALLVYRAADDNPAGLAPGDVIVGYDGAPWAELLDEIDSWQLPLCGSVGSADQVMEWMRLSSVTANPHLFAELDVRRQGASEIEAIPTAGLLDYGSRLACTDQLPVAGVDFPWVTDEEGAEAGTDAAWGILEGTNIGYIYMYSQYLVWNDLPAALADLAGTSGIVIDQRYNHGGWPSPHAFDQLFAEPVANLWNCAERDPAADDYAALAPNDHDWYYIEGDPEAYAGPIAVLQGPHAVSGGDLFPYAMSKSPNVRRFGRITHGSYGCRYDFWDRDPFIADLRSTYTGCVFLDAELDVMQKWENHPDEEIWLSPADVADGVDTVVAAAVSWLESQGAAK